MEVLNYFKSQVAEGSSADYVTACGARNCATISQINQLREIPRTSVWRSSSTVGCNGLVNKTAPALGNWVKLLCKQIEAK